MMPFTQDVEAFYITIYGGIIIGILFDLYRSLKSNFKGGNSKYLGGLKVFPQTCDVIMVCHIAQAGILITFFFFSFKMNLLKNGLRKATMFDLSF